MIQSKTPFLPEDVGYYKERLDVLNEHFKTLIEEKKIMSANYCLAREGKIFAEAAIGKFCYREDDTREVGVDTIFPIASMTKLFTAVSIFKLAEDGKLRISQKVGDILPEFATPPYNEITIAHLLTHTSGLHADPGAHENKYFVSPWYYIFEGRKDFQDESWVAAGLRSGVETKPGIQWSYCSFGYVILGEIITRVSGVFANDYIMENIIKPCEMEDTHFDLILKYVNRYHIRHERGEEAFKKLLKGELEEEYEKIPGTGGGLFSTTSDIIKFGNMLCNMGTFRGKRIIGRKAVEKMTRQYTDENIKNYCWGAQGCERPYGLGPDMKNDEDNMYSIGTYFHEGAGTCCMVIDPVEKFVAVWFAQFYDAWHAEALFNASAIM